MTGTTDLPKGMRLLPSGRVQARYQGKTLGTYADLDAANVARGQAKLDAKAGRKPRKGNRADPTLDAAAGVFQAAQEARAERGQIATSTAAQTVKELRPWRDGTTWTAIDEDGFAFAAQRISQLATEDLEAWYAERSADAPEAARKELFAFKAVLRASRAAAFEPGLLTISPGRRKRRKGRALRPDVLAHFADAFPERLRTLPLFGGTVGLRIGEALGLQWDWVDFQRGTIYVPDWACKERRDKTIPCLPDEMALLEEQSDLIGDASPYVWPRPRGGAWPHWSFYGKVWAPAVELAQASWVAAGGLALDFQDLRPHDLRHTAATLMRRAGFDAELAALRLGHADAGWLLMTVYNHPDPDDLQAQMQAVAGRGILSSLGRRRPVTQAATLRLVPAVAGTGRRQGRNAPAAHRSPLAVGR